MAVEEFRAPSGWHLWYLPEVTSTNDVAKEAGTKGAPERSVFVTDHQTRGRGRKERSWLEPPGSSLLLSILFRRHLSQSFLLTMMCSVAAAEAVERVAGVVPQIKWPNDLMLSGRKLAGILTEVNWFPGKQFAVVGMGLNVNFDPPTIKGVPDNATSLLRETGREYSRPELLYAILERLDVYLAENPAAVEPRVRAEWADRLWRRRQKVVIAEGGKVMEGVFEDVAEDGALLLRLDNGKLLPIRAGDLQI